MTKETQSPEAQADRTLLTALEADEARMKIADSLLPNIQNIARHGLVPTDEIACLNGYCTAIQSLLTKIYERYSPQIPPRV